MTTYLPEPHSSHPVLSGAGYLPGAQKRQIGAAGPEDIPTGHIYGVFRGVLGCIYGVYTCIMGVHRCIKSVKKRV